MLFKMSIIADVLASVIRWGWVEGREARKNTRSEIVGNFDDDKSTSKSEKGMA